MTWTVIELSVVDDSQSEWNGLIQENVFVELSPQWSEEGKVKVQIEILTLWEIWNRGAGAELAMHQACLNSDIANEQ